MTPVKCRLECEACGLGFVVTYDADIPTKILEIQCRCGHRTPIKQAPEPRPSHQECDEQKAAPNR